MSMLAVAPTTVMALETWSDSRTEAVFRLPCRMTRMLEYSRQVSDPIDSAPSTRMSWASNVISASSNISELPVTVANKTTKFHHDDHGHQFEQ